MNPFLKSRPRTSQLTVCVKDLYRPLERQIQLSGRKNYFYSYRLKLLNIRESARSFSPITPKIINCSMLEVKKPEGMIIKMMQTPGSKRISKSPDLGKKFIEKSKSPKHEIFVQNSLKNRPVKLKSTSTSLQAKKIELEKFALKKRKSTELRIKPKIIPIPKVEYLCGWEE